MLHNAMRAMFAKGHQTFEDQQVLLDWIVTRHPIQYCDKILNENP